MNLFGKEVPNPGSKEAIEAGCTCAVMDNNYGKGFGDPPLFWMNVDCKIHGIGDVCDRIKKNDSAQPSEP